MVTTYKRRACGFLYIGKKGSAHFEIIISFILFVSFTLFLVLSLEPTKQDLLEESILYGVADTFFADVKTNVSSVLLFVNKSGETVCSSSNDFTACLPSEFSSSINSFSVDKEKPCTHYVYSSNEFVSQSLGLCTAENKQYSLGYIERQEVISNKTLNLRKTEYYNDYNASKTRFGVPAVVDFAVVIEGTDFAMQKTIPDEAEVISGVYRKRVIYANGSIVNLDFIVKVW